jgi:glucose/arabinose dehydrogenase
LAALGLIVTALTAPGQPLIRVPNTTLAMPSAPPALGYTSTNAFGSLTFVNPVAIVSPPGETNRVFIVEKNGTIQVITNLAAPTKSLFLNITNNVISTTNNSTSNGEQGLLGMAFHPGYATNRYFFVFYTGNATTAAGTGRHDILSRFQTTAGNTNLADAASEVRLIAQYDQQPNHDGGDIQFGPDGYLYVPLGDEGGGDDNQVNSQRINKDFFSGILRIDVDKRPGSLNPNPHASIIAPTNYAVPPDNPFVGATSFNGSAVTPSTVRTEFWAVGLRNPWRITFDPVTAELYCADVGQAAREEVNLITKGANYGWNYWEGFLQRTNPPPAGFTNTLPLIDYAHTAGRVCIIGGVVSRGARLPQLYGAYLYAEYATGEIWYLRQAAGAVTESNLLFNAGAGERIATFGTDPSNGDVLYAAHFTTGWATNSQIKRIIHNNTTNGAPIPPLLTGTGAFADLATLTPAAGVVPYGINVPFWSDNAVKSRWFSVPNTNLTIGFDATANWSFPTGTVWIKHFDLELTNGVPSSRKRIETRLLVKNSTGVYGVTYRWGDSTTNAALVSEAGMDELFVTNDGGILTTQAWHYPSRLECNTCHTTEGGFGLGFNTPQLNHAFDFGSGATNQIAALSAAGYLNTPVTDTGGLIALAHATNESASLEFRVRSYLTANCVQCHQPGASAQQANWDARITTPTALAGLINGTLTDNFGDLSNRVVAPLSLSNSMLHTRISLRGSRQMPPLATAIVDTQNVALVAQWIGGLSNTFWLGVAPTPQSVTAGSATNIAVTALATSDFTSNLTLSASGLPYGTHAAFTPATMAISNSSTLRVTTSASTPAGSYALNVSGIGGSAANSTIAILNVSPFASSYVFEAEDLPFVTNGAAATVQLDVNSSNGEWEALLADGVGDYIDYSIPSLPAGTYQFKLLYKSHPNRGSLGMTVDGATVTNALDQYAAIPAYPEPGFGTLTFGSAAPHIIRQTVVGRNAAAGAYTLSADRFTFTLNTPPSPTPPHISSAVLTGGDLLIAGTSDLTNGVYYVLATTNLASPPAQWTCIATNVTDGAANFSAAVPINANDTSRFYRLQLP